MGIDVFYRAGQVPFYFHTYKYDHTNQRIAVKKGSEQSTIYPTKYYNVQGSKTTRHIFAGDDLLATIENNSSTASTYYLHTDHLGGTSVSSDEAGNIAQVTDYYPFGGIRIDEKAGTFDEQRKFTGQEYERERS